MTIIAENDLGWLICHKMYLNRLYETCIDLTSEEKCKFRIQVLDSLFNIDNNFIMDTEAKKLSNSELIIHRKKRKCLKDVSDPHYDKVRLILENALDQLIKIGKECNYINDRPLMPNEVNNNNSSAKAVTKILNKNSLLQIYNGKTSKKEFKSDEIDKLKESLSDIIIYPFDLPGISLFLGEKYIIPNETQFFLGDICQIERLLKTKKNAFDVILMDPPWFNKSNKRKKSYSMLHNEDLLKLPIPQLANSNCLIIVWATNNWNQITFIKEKLFPKWLVQHCADWHWIKITKRGIPVLPLDFHHKKPYENLIIGRIKNSENHSDLPIIPDHKVIISIPSSIHSHKPPLTEILSRFCVKNPKYLELFARYLIPGWTSYGNEVLKLQDLNLFKISKLDNKT